MHEDVKICPNCDAEYFAHIETCKECNVTLVRPDETLEITAQPYSGTTAGADDCASETGAHKEGLAYVETGPLGRVTEFSKILEKSGIKSEIIALSQGSSCSSDFALLVEEQYEDGAKSILKEYWLTMHPEIRDSEEKERQGLCPACGADVKHNPMECHDCGLTLGVVETEEESS